MEFCLQNYSTFTLLTFYFPQSQITTYADDMTITASYTKHNKAQQLIQPYLHKIYEWATTDNLHINTDKPTTTLFTPDPAEYSTTLSLKINNQTLPTTKHPKILRITLEPKLTFSQHINVTITKAKQMLNILKALNSIKWCSNSNSKLSHSKLSLALFWNMQTPYGALSYQIPTSRNCKPFKTQLCESPLTAHKIQTLNIYQSPSNGYPSHTSCHSS